MPSKMEIKQKYITFLETKKLSHFSIHRNNELIYNKFYVVRNLLNIKNITITYRLYFGNKN